ncbi:MAG: response regulator [bacterium]
MTKKTARDMKVLIVDDEQLVRWFLERALKRWNFEVVAVSSVEDALKHLNTEQFDLIFTDLKMPSGNGVLIVNKLNRMEKPPHLIVCSAFITLEMEEEFKSKGIQILKKPFKLDELESSLKKLVSL